MICYLPDTAIKSARSKRHPLAHVPQQKAPLYLSVQCNIWHRNLNKEKYFMSSNPNLKKQNKTETHSHSPQFSFAHFRETCNI